MNINCTICEKQIEPSEDTSLTPCGHIFHSKCISQSVKRSKLCPQCQKEVLEAEINRVYFSFLKNSTVDVNTMKSQVENLNLKIAAKEKEIEDSRLQLMYLKNIFSRRQMVRNLHQDIVFLMKQVIEKVGCPINLKNQLTISERERFELVKKLQTYEVNKSPIFKSCDYLTDKVKSFTEEIKPRRSLRLQNKSNYLTDDVITSTEEKKPRRSLRLQNKSNGTFVANQINLNDSLVRKRKKSVDPLEKRKKFMVEKCLSDSSNLSNEFSLKEGIFTEIANLTEENEELSPYVRSKLTEISSLKKLLEKL